MVTCVNGDDTGALQWPAPSWPTSPSPPSAPVNLCSTPYQPTDSNCIITVSPDGSKSGE
jgi:hypothetical protein